MYKTVNLNPRSQRYIYLTHCRGNLQQHVHYIYWAPTVPQACFSKVHKTEIQHSWTKPLSATWSRLCNVLASSLVAQVIITCQSRRHRRWGFSPWRVRKIPWKMKWQPSRVFLPGKLPWTKEPGWPRSLMLQRIKHSENDTHIKKGKVIPKTWESGVIQVSLERCKH